MKSKLKILFIQSLYSIIDDRLVADFPPLGIGYLIAYLKKKIKSVNLEVQFANKNIEEEILDFDPDLICISSVTQDYGRAIEYSRLIKEKFSNKPILIGGVHISSCQNSLDKTMDIGVLGEGEETFYELINLFLLRGVFDQKDLIKINGIAFWGGDGKLKITPPRNLIEPLDKIPFSDRSFFNRRGGTYIITSRGCPFKCAFCSSSHFWKKVRFFSAEYVVNEIKHLREKYQVKTVMVYDDLFPASRERVKRIIDLLDNENLLGKIRFHGAIRANLVDEEICYLLKKMGFNSLGLGLESMSPSVLKYLKGENITVEDNYNAVKLIRKYGMGVSASFIIGTPHETEKDIRLTYEFLEKARLDNFWIYLLTPFPGTPVWDYAKKRGLVSDDMDWNRLNVNYRINNLIKDDRAIILSENLNRKEIIKWFLKFQRLKKKQFLFRRAKYLTKKFLFQPWKIPQYLWKRLFQF
jgi:radical SAM superfamily enzyme YgiQ (UPF0313 family)